MMIMHEKGCGEGGGRNANDDSKREYGIEERESWLAEGRDHGRSNTCQSSLMVPKMNASSALEVLVSLLYFDGTYSYFKSPNDPPLCYNMPLNIILSFLQENFVLHPPPKKNK